jgi:hypothetical protein
MRELFETLMSWLAHSDGSVPAMQSESERRMEQLHAQGRMPFLP